MRKLPLFIAGICIYLCLFIAIVVAHKQKHTVPFDEDEIDQSYTEDAEYLFMGNSMLQSRIDVPILRTLTQKRIGLIWKHGTAIDEWHMWLRDFILPSKKVPKTIIIFVRHTHLTNTAKQERNIRRRVRLARLENANVSERALTNRTWQAILKKTIYNSFKVNMVNKSIRRYLQKIFTVHQRKKHINGFFAHHPLRSYNPTKLRRAEDEYDFHKNLSGSSLALFTNLAKKHSIHLVFVRIKLRADMTESKKCQYCDRPEEEYQQYMKDLQDYIEENGNSYYDFSQDPRITKKDIQDDGGHFMMKQKKRYTSEIFYPTLQPEFE